MKRFLFICILGIISFFGFTISANAISGTQTVDDGVYIIRSSMNENMVLDVACKSTADGANVQLFNYTGADNQKWNVKHLGNGYYSITTAMDNNKSLDVYRGSTEAGANVQLFTYKGGDNQQWIIKDAGDGYYYIVAKNSGLQLDIYRANAVNEANIQVFTARTTANQKFKFDLVKSEEEYEPVKTVEDGTYVIKSALNENMVLDVACKSTADGANVQLFNYTGADNQKWNVKHLGNGYYSITTAMDNNKSLDVYRGSTEAGANVQLFTYKGGDNQQWIIKDAGDGYYYIVAKNSGLQLDIYRANAVNEANIQVFTARTTANQKFKFEPVKEELPEKTVEDGTYVIQSSLNENMVLDVAYKSTANGANVQLFNYTGSNNQKWNVKYLGDGYYSITTAMSDSMSLDVYCASTVSGANVQLFTYKGGDNQQWIIKDAGDGYYYIVAKNSGLYLDIYKAQAVNQANIQVFDKRETTNQKFKFVSTDVNTDEQVFANGVYTFSPILNENKNFDVEAKSRLNGTKVSLFDVTNANNQLWYLEYVSEGYYKINSAMNTKLALTAIDNGVVISKYNGSNSQLWRLKDLGNQTISIISKANELHLSLENSQFANNTSIILADGSNADTQKFKISEYTKQKVYNGIDVSYYQKTINWEAVSKSDIEFVIIRAGYGGDWTEQDDEKFMEYVAACEKYNIPYGLYLYSYASEIDNSDTSAQAEARHMLRLIDQIEKNNYSPNLGTKVFIDMEDGSVINAGKDKLTAVSDTFCSIIENNGYNCGVYANRTWLTNYLNANEIASKYEIWLAEYLSVADPSFSYAKTQKPIYNLTPIKYWQFASNGVVNGINGSVDLDLGYDIFD